MGLRGPAPKPTELKRLAGNPGGRPLNDREPRPEAGEPSRPAWLLPEAKREWGRVVPELKRLGLLAKIDRAALAAYCQSYARWMQAERVIREKGLTFKTATGYLQQRPEVGISHKERQLMRVFCHEFGLTPASRSNIRTPGEEPPADEFAAFLSGSFPARAEARAAAVAGDEGADDE